MKAAGMSGIDIVYVVLVLVDQRLNIRTRRRRVRSYGMRKASGNPTRSQPYKSMTPVEAVWKVASCPADLRSIGPIHGL